MIEMLFIFSQNLRYFALNILESMISGRTPWAIIGICFRNIILKTCRRRYKIAVT